MTPYSPSATSVAARVQLHKQALLPALADPALGAISFLNEVIDRFPQAISFAPGAPFAAQRGVPDRRGLGRPLGLAHSERLTRGVLWCAARHA